MAIIGVDLGVSDEIINTSNATNGDFLNISALGSHTLTVEGVDVTVNSILSLAVGATPTFAVTDGGALTVDLGLFDASLLSSVNYVVGDYSSLHLDGSTLSLLSNLLSTATITFTGQQDGVFSYDPAAISLLSPMTFDIYGMEAMDQLIIDGRSNLSFSYNATSDIGTITSFGGLLGQSVTYRIHDMGQHQADQIFADLGNSSSDIWVDGETFTYPVCLTAGTLVRTPRGAIPVETLREGDLVTTYDHGPRPLRWIGAQRFSPAELAANGNLQPVVISPGALGRGAPERQLAVSGQHRILAENKVVERMFGEEAVLGAACQFCGVEGIKRRSSLASVTYFALLFDKHEIICANGAPVESLYPGPMALEALSDQQAREVRQRFPALFDKSSSAPPPARPIADAKRLRTMVTRLAQNRMHVLSEKPRNGALRLGV